MKSVKHITGLIHPFSKCLLSAGYVPETALSARSDGPSLHGTHSEATKGYLH